jgi:hypothetical protein
LEYGPEQLAALASDPHMAHRLLGRVARIARALPESLQPVVWTLVLNPKAEIEIPEGPKLPRPVFDECIALVESGVAAIGHPGDGLSENEKKRRQRARARLDPGPCFILADEWRGGAPTLGMAVSVDATAMLAGRVIASPSQAYRPVHYTVASVTDSKRVVLQPLATRRATRAPSFQFIRNPL